MQCNSPLSILVLAANPGDRDQLRLDREVRAIENRLRNSSGPRAFAVHTWQAVRLEDISLAILKTDPHVVHFCGHGHQNGIAVEDEKGDTLIVEPSALGNLFHLVEDQVQCVVLNACLTLSQATIINRHIKFVIGMSSAIEDESAIRFAEGFYEALGAGRPIEKAYEFGRNALLLHNLPGHLTPRLLIRCSASPQYLIECIKRQQKKHVKESFGEMAHQCFTSDDLVRFLQAGIGTAIVQTLEADPAFDDIVVAIKNMAASEREELLNLAANVCKPTWAEIGEIDPAGQTDAGQSAEKTVAGAICDLVRRRIK